MSKRKTNLEAMANSCNDEDLRSALEAEKSKVRVLQRQKVAEVKHVKDAEKRKYTVALGDLKTKLHQEKLKEVEQVREIVSKKYENEIQVITKQKDSEILRLQADVKKIQGDYELVRKDGGESPKKRAYEEQRYRMIEAENAKLCHDLLDMKKSKKKLDDSYHALLCADREKLIDLRRTEEEHKLEVAKLKKEAHIETRKLLDEIQASNRIVMNLKKELGYQSENYHSDVVNKNYISSIDLHAQSTPKSAVVNSESDSDSAIGMSPRQDGEITMYQTRISDLCSKNRWLEDRNAILQQDKNELIQRNKELEKRYNPVQDKNKKFLKKNIELTQLNRTLEDKVKKVVEDNKKLKNQMDENLGRTESLSQELKKEQDKNVDYVELREKYRTLKKNMKQLRENQESLEQECSERERRIDLLRDRLHRLSAHKHSSQLHLKHQPDEKSLDSEVANILAADIEPHSLTVNDTGWDDLSQEEFERNYRRLMKEHHSLEKANTVLRLKYQNYIANSCKNKQYLESQLKAAHNKIENLEDKFAHNKEEVPQPSRKRRLPEINWIAEKQKLNASNKSLLEKVRKLEETSHRLQDELKDSAEQNENLEFRVLELEEQRQAKSSGANPNEEDDTEITFDEIHSTALNIDDLKNKIEELKTKYAAHLGRSEKTVLLQAKAMLDIADKRNKSQETIEKALRERISLLETEKAELLSEQGISSDLVLEFEEARNKLIDTELKLDELVSENKELRESEAALKYKENIYNKREDKFKQENAELKKQLAASMEGRGSETAFIQQRMDKLRFLQQQLSLLENSNTDLTNRLMSLQEENSNLLEQISNQDTSSLDKLGENEQKLAGTISVLKEQLQKAKENEKSLSAQNSQSMKEMELLRNKNAELEDINKEISSNFHLLKDKLVSTKDDVDVMKKKLKESASGSPGGADELQRKVRKLEQDNLDLLKELIVVRQEQNETESAASSQPQASSDLEKDNMQLRTDNFKLKEELSAKEKEMKETHGITEQKNKENLALRKKFAEYEQLKKDLPMMKTEHNARLYEIKMVKEENFHLKKKLEELEKKLKDGRSKPDGKTVMADEDVKAALLTPFKAALAPINVSIPEVEEEMTPDTLGEEEKAALQSTIDQLKERIHDLETSESILKQNIQDLVKQADIEKASMEQLRNKLADVDKLKEKVDRSKEKKKTLKEQVKELAISRQDTVRLKDEENRTLHEEIESLELKNMELLEKNSKKDEEKNKICAELKDIEQKFAIASESENHLKKSLEEQKDSHVSKMEKLHDMIDKLQKNDIRLTESLTEAEQKEKELSERLMKYEGPDSEYGTIDEYKSRLEELQRSKADLSTDLDQIESIKLDLEIKNEELLAKNENLLADITEAEARCKELDLKMQEIIPKLETSERRCEEYQKELDLIPGQLSEKTESENRLTNKINELENENAKHLKRISVLDTLVDELNNGKEKHKERISELETELEKMMTQNDDLTKQIKQLQNELEKERNESKQKDDLLNNIKNELDGKNSEISQIQETINELEAENESKLNKCSELENVIKDHEAEQSIKASQVESLQSSLSAHKEDQSNLSDTITELHKHIDEQKSLIQERDHEIQLLAEEYEREKNELNLSQQKIEDLLDENIKYEEHINELEEQIAIANQDANEYQQKADDFKQKLSEKVDEISRLEEEFDESREDDAKEAKQLKEKAKVLLEGEQKMLDRILQLETSEKELQEELDNFTDISQESPRDNLQQEIADLTKENDNLKNSISDLENSKSQELKKRQDSLEIMSQKVNQLMNLLESSEKIQNDLKVSVAESEKTINELKQQLNDSSEKQVAMQEKINNLEKSELELQEQMAVSQLDNVSKDFSIREETTPYEIQPQYAPAVQSGLSVVPQQLDSDEKERMKRSLKRKTPGELVNKVIELTEVEHLLQNKIAELEDPVNMDRSRTESVERELESNHDREQRYKDTIVRLQKEIELIMLNSAGAASSVDEQGHRKSSKELNKEYQKRLDDLQEHLDSFVFVDKSPSSDSKTPPHFTSKYSDLPEDEMINKIQHLEMNEIKNNRKMAELEDCIKVYRQVVETVAFSMASDLESVDLQKGNVLALLARPKDTAYEEKLQQLVNGETALKKQLVEYEKKEGMLKADVAKAVTDLQNSNEKYEQKTKQYEDRIEELEESEAKLKQKINSALGKERTSETLSKIHDLKDRIFDLEASEKRLLRRVKELEEIETDLRQKLADTSCPPYKNEVKSARLRDLEHQQELDELKHEITTLESSEKALQDQVKILKSHDNSGLLEKIEHFQRTERNMQKKLDLYEEQLMSREDLSTSLNQPEDILKQRIIDLQKMEDHLRAQNSELESDREDLHELVRKNRNTIHDLEIKLRERQLSEKNLKDHLNKLELSENNLAVTVDTMQDEIDDLQDQLHRVRTAGRNWKGQAKDLQYSEESAEKRLSSLRLTVDELQASETALKKNIYSLEQKNNSLRDKIAALEDVIYDHQKAETVFKNKIKDLELNEKLVRSDLSSFECSKTVSEKRAIEYEVLNDSLQNKIYRLEEEISGLKYDVSDLQVTNRDLEKQVALVENNDLSLQQQVQFYQTKEKRYQKLIENLDSEKSELERRIVDAETNEKIAKERVQTIQTIPLKTCCDHEVEIGELKSQLNYYNNLLKEKENLLNMLPDLATEKAELDGKYQTVQAELRLLKDNLKDGDVIIAQVSQKKALAEKGSQTTKSLDSVDEPKTEDSIPLRDQLQPVQVQPQNAVSKPVPNSPEHVKALDDLANALSFGDLENEHRPSPTHDSPEVIEPEISSQNKPKVESAPNLDNLAEHLPPQKSNTKTKPDAGRKMRSGRSPRPRQYGGEDSDSSVDEVPVAGGTVRRSSAMFDVDPRQQDIPVLNKQPDSEMIQPTHRQPAQMDSRHGRSSSPKSHRTYPTSQAEPYHRHQPAERENEEDHWRTIENQPSPSHQKPRPEDRFWKQVESKPNQSKSGKPLFEDLTVSMTISDDETSDVEGHHGTVPPPRIFSDKHPNVHNSYYPQRDNDEIPSLIDFSHSRSPAPQRRIPRTRSNESVADSGVSTMPIGDPEYSYINFPNSRLESKPTSRQSNQPHEAVLRPASANRAYGQPTQFTPRNAAEVQEQPQLSEWLTHQLVDNKSMASNTERFQHRGQQPAWPVGPMRNVSTDTEDLNKQLRDEIQKLQQKIADLECENRIKQRELETYQFVNKGMEDKMKDAEDTFTWKAKLKDKERDLQALERVNRDLTEENTKLEEELYNKQRQVSELQGEVNNLDKVINSKEAAGSEAIIDELKKDLLHTQNVLEQATNHNLDLEKQLRQLKISNDRKDKDVNFKNNKLEEAEREISRCKDAARESEKQRMEMQGQLRSAEQDLLKLNEADKKLQALREEYEKLLMKNADLQEQIRQLEIIKREKIDLEQTVDGLKGQLKNYNQLKADKAGVDVKLDMVQEALENKTVEAEQINAEKQSLTSYIKRLEGEGASDKENLKDYDQIKARYNEMEKIKDRAERAVAPLRAKVTRLAHKCKQKDDMIKRLADEMQKNGSLSQPLKADVDQIRDDMALEEYNRPLSPIGGSVQDDMIPASSVAQQESSPRTYSNPPMSYDNYSQKRPNENEMPHKNAFNNPQNGDIVPTRLGRQEHAPPSHSNLDLDETMSSSSRMPQLNNQRFDMQQHSPHPENYLSKHSPRSQQPDKPSIYQAITDYDPKHFSRSGHPNLDLPLREGDVVKVFGPMDDTGYYEGEVNGRTGLVPADYLQPLHQDANPRRQKKPNQPSYTDSPEQVMDMYDNLQRSHTPNHQVPDLQSQARSPFPPNFVPQRGNVPIPSTGCTEILPTTVIRDQSQQPSPNLEHTRKQRPKSSPDIRPVRDTPNMNRPTSRQSNREGPPEPPSDFRISRILSNETVMVEWLPPRLDDLDRSNGIQITGYKIYVDGDLKHEVSSPHISKSLVGKLDLSKPHKISIQSYSTLGDKSRVIHTRFDDILPEFPGEGMSDLGSHLGDEMERGSMMSSSYYENGEKRIFAALYDYKPSGQSPNRILSMKAGDPVAVYGPLRSDGFYHAKVHGRKGLVPASFLEELPLKHRKHKKSSKRTGSLHSQSSTSSQEPSSKSTDLPSSAQPSHNTISPATSKVIHDV